MTDTKQRATVFVAASVLALSLGMVALNAEAEQVKHSTTNQVKQTTGSNQDKWTTGSTQEKWTTGNANQHKLGTTSNQTKPHTTTTPQLNPQPEPPKPSGPASH